MERIFTAGLKDLKTLNMTSNVPNTVRVILIVWVENVGLDQVSVTGSCGINVTN